MKKIISSLLFSFLFISSISAQTIEMGKSLYQQGDYERAIFVFERVDGLESQLFLGKSHFAERNYLKAVNVLRQIDRTSQEDWYQDASYTSALAHFQLDNFDKALETLFDLIQSSSTSAITRSADKTYNDIIGFLTPNQRFEAFKTVSNDEIRLDILEYSVGRIDYSKAQTLFSLFEESTLNQNPLRLNRIKTQLADSVTYSSQQIRTNYLTAPRGIDYNLGVVLPEFDFEAPEYEIPQHLYYGIQIAVEQFNRENIEQKAFITYRSTNTGNSSAEAIISDFVFKDGVDVIIGPLFSQVAKEFSNLAEEYEIPMLLPLANADSLDLYNNYVFQLNPAFGTQGKVMAREALELGYDTLGVIAEARSLGAPAARAFRHEAERLGGYVEYYFEENFVELGYDIRDYTQFFTTDTLDSVNMVKAVYAPFTGTIAQTLIESMLTDLEAMRSEVAIFGSEEWQEVNIEARRLDSTQLYFTRSFDVDTSTSSAREFISEFRIRFQTDPNQFAFIGFDAATIILNQLNYVKNPAYLRDYLRNLRGYKGLSIDVDFNGTHVNEAIGFDRMIRESEIEISADSVQIQTEFRRRR
jgi:ABC-type branched-subunit amino acid transport system substrate-binding protein